MYYICQWRSQGFQSVGSWMPMIFFAWLFSWVHIADVFSGNKNSMCISLKDFLVREIRGLFSWMHIADVARWRPLGAWDWAARRRIIPGTNCAQCVRMEIQMQYYGNTMCPDGNTNTLLQKYNVSRWKYKCNITEIQWIPMEIQIQYYGNTMCPDGNTNIIL